MAVDKNGKSVHVGSIVSIRAVVMEVDPHEEGINVVLESLEPQYPSDRKTPFHLNSKQVVVLKNLGDTETDIDVREFRNAERLAESDAMPIVKEEQR